MKLHITYLCLSLLLLLSSSTFAQRFEREVKLEGGINFRDLGAYPTQSGKKVKQGKIYRSADISKLTDQDLKKLEALHLAVDCDLRGPAEVKAAPDRIPTGVRYINLPAGSENTGTMNNSFSMMKNTVNGDSLIKSFYDKTEHFRAKYKPMFDSLLTLKDNESLLFHCTAGKDRTGMAAMLILSALGVDEKTIVADYTATNYYRAQSNEQYIGGMVQNGIKPEVAKAMMAANASYIQVTFDTLKKQYGSVEQFLVKEIELTPEKMNKLKAKFLE